MRLSFILLPLRTRWREREYCIHSDGEPTLPVVYSNVTILLFSILHKLPIYKTIFTGEYTVVPKKNIEIHCMLVRITKIKYGKFEYFIIQHIISYIVSYIILQ